jgi:hypothetical protein
MGFSRQVLGVAFAGGGAEGKTVVRPENIFD